MRPISKTLHATRRPLGVSGRAQVHGGTLRELYEALVAHGRWWLVPMVAVLVLSALLLVAVAAIEYVAPFVYTIF